MRRAMQNAAGQPPAAKYMHNPNCSQSLANIMNKRHLLTLRKKVVKMQEVIVATLLHYLVINASKTAPMSNGLKAYYWANKIGQIEFTALLPQNKISSSASKNNDFDNGINTPPANSYPKLQITVQWNNGTVGTIQVEQTTD
jgi:hypothetical protein